MKSSMNWKLYVPSRFTPGSQSPPVWPVSVPDPTYPEFTGAVTVKFPAHPPPPTPWVRPFHAPCTPPVPPSTELSGSPTRMLMFWFAEVPYSTFTWQYALFGPLAAMIAALTLLISRLRASPRAGSVASWLHVTGELAGLSFAVAGDAKNPRLRAVAASPQSVRVGFQVVARIGGDTAAMVGARTREAGVAVERVTEVPGRTVIMFPSVGCVTWPAELPPSELSSSGLSKVD